TALHAPLFGRRITYFQAVLWRVLTASTYDREAFQVNARVFVCRLRLTTAAWSRRSSWRHGQSLSLTRICHPCGALNPRFGPERLVYRNGICAIQEPDASYELEQTCGYRHIVRTCKCECLCVHFFCSLNQSRRFWPALLRSAA